ncbi:MAG: twin-arginine translocase subunit TatC, partial [Alphaproteobacteria bacterium]|nr:twin-arginine translocase subunit TatC [Alphaproteobacteria bacterium]
APLMAHVIELRTRLIYSVIAFAIAFGICFSFAEPIYAFLVEPLADAYPDPSTRRMIYTGLAEAFVTYMKLGLFGGVFLAFPVIAFQLYRFIAPGLYKRERFVVLPFLLAAPILFIIGAALAYYFVIPMAWKFFLGFEHAAVQGMGLPIMLEARVGEYLSLTMHILIAFGVAFQLPVVLTLMARAGFVKSSNLGRYRKYALLGIITLSAVITPPDIFSQIGLSIPLYLLYELSIISCRMIEHRADIDPTTKEDSNA